MIKLFFMIHYIRIFSYNKYLFENYLIFILFHDIYP